MLLMFYLLFTGPQGSEGCKLVYTRSEIKDPRHISAYLGGSVLLPCYCTDLSTTPEKLTWKKDNMKTSEWEEVSNESGPYRDRVQLFNSHSPGNLSLLISHLTEEDGGQYTCDSEEDRIIIRLSVLTPPGLTPTTTPTTTTTGPTTTTSSTAVVKVPLSLSTSSTASSQTPAEHGAVTPAERAELQSMYFLIFIPVPLLLLGLGGAVYWRYRGQCGGQSGEQRGRKREQDTADQVTYSTVSPQEQQNNTRSD
ncbi:CMRF35-like molecule 6 [Hoplias malabaricus]|uniref:CMRF35-like molecule 6 n=1 Tax=Hoplias malabaricus TaxID=27720 RepID=UPI0034623FE2